MLSEFTFEITVKTIGDCESSAFESALEQLDGLDITDRKVQIVSVVPVAGDDEGN